MLSDQVYDIIGATQAAIRSHAVQSRNDVAHAPPLVCFSPKMRTQALELKRFLFQNLYRHPKVIETTDWAKEVVTHLFKAYVDSPQEMPKFYKTRVSVQRAVSDYIAGMTDRFAVSEFTRLCSSAAKEIGIK